MDHAGLKIINIGFNQINGGSISLDISKKKSKHKENKAVLKWLLLREKLNGFNSLKIQKKFFVQARRHKYLLNNLLKKLKSEKKLIYGYGASTKGNVILQYCNINNKLIDCIIEVNSFKYNRFTPGTKIKIVSEKFMKKKKPDYLLVLPWHFKDHIIKKEKKFLDSGGKLIFPLPEIEIV